MEKKKGALKASTRIYLDAKRPGVSIPPRIVVPAENCRTCEKAVESLKAAGAVLPTPKFGHCPECGASGRYWALGESHGCCELDSCPEKKFLPAETVLVPDDADLTDPRD